MFCVLKVEHGGLILSLKGCLMDLWVIILLIALLSGIFGWGVTVFVNAVYWFCEWREGNPINWGLDLGLAIGVPFAWTFSILEIMLLYMR